MQALIQRVLNTRVASLFMITFLITACGGGGSSSSAAIENGSDNSITIGNNDAGAAISTQKTMQELVAADDFLFTSKEEVQVSVSLNEYNNKRAYISVYGDYQQLPSGRYYPNAGSRTTAGNLEQGQFKSSFITHNEQPTFLVEVWLYDGQDAIQKELSLTNNKLTW